MQRRFHLSHHPDFDSALAAKNKLEKERSNEYFQIRKRKANFEVVGRVSIKEATNEVIHQITPKKKRAPRQVWKKSEDAPAFKMEYNNVKARQNRTGKWYENDIERMFRDKTNNEDKL